MSDWEQQIKELGLFDTDGQIEIMYNEIERLTAADTKLVAMIQELCGMMQQPIEFQRNSAERARILVESVSGKSTG